jgi:hypothetical protein
MPVVGVESVVEYMEEPIETADTTAVLAVEAVVCKP